MLGEKIAEFAVKHPWITLFIISDIGVTLRKTAYILRTGKMPSDFEVRMEPTKPAKPDEEERDKHVF